MERIKVCFVKFTEKARKIYMFEMPSDSYLAKGETVIVPDADGNETEATVVDTEKYQQKYEHEWDDLKRLLNVAGVELPLRKVLGKVERTYYKWDETEEEDECE